MLGPSGVVRLINSPGGVVEWPGSETALRRRTALPELNTGFRTVHPPPDPLYGCVGGSDPDVGCVDVVLDELILLVGRDVRQIARRAVERLGLGRIPCGGPGDVRGRDVLVVAVGDRVVVEVRTGVDRRRDVEVERAA